MAEILQSLMEVEKLEVTTLVDNYVDVLLPSTDIVQRPPLAKDLKIPTDTLLAEHGLSMLVTTYSKNEEHHILFDTGYSQVALVHNMDILEIKPQDIEAVVMSHAHMDHTGGLYPFLEKLSGPVPVALHPDAFLCPRYFLLEGGQRLLFPCTLVAEELKKHGAEIVETKAPTVLGKGTVLVTGEVERVTNFEKGLPNAMMEKNGEVVKDAILDDQALVVNVKGKGLVVISGCSHAGIINTLLYAKKVTGIEKIYGVIGGFHLSGAFFEPIIEDTIAQLKTMSPQVLVPMHCTGWKAIERFSQEFPNAFILNSVGSKFIFSS